MNQENFQNLQFSEDPPTKKGILFFIFALFLISIFCFGAALATRTWDPIWNPFRPKPEKVIQRMMSEMKKVKTKESRADISVKLENEAKLEVKAKIEGREDKSVPEKPKLEQKFEFELTNFISKQPMGIETKIAIAGEIKKLDEKVYLKLTSLPFIPFFEMLGIDLSKIKDQWIRVDEQSIEEVVEQILPLEEKFKEKREKEKALQKEVEKKIEKIISESKFYFLKKQFPDEKINGVKVYHYLIALDKKETSKMITEILKVLKETSEKIYGESSFSFEEEKEIKERLEEFFKKIGEIEAELWIGKNDYLLYRLKGEKILDLSKIEEGEKGLFSIKLIIENSKFNKPVKIEEPSEVKTIKEILTPFLELFEKTQKFSPSFRENEQIREEEQIIYNLYRVEFVADSLYSQNNSYKNLCQNFKLNTNLPNYGSELKKIEEEIKKLQGGKISLSCYSSKDSFCLLVDLVDPKRGKFCLDSQGFVGKISRESQCRGKGTTNDPYACPKESLFPFNYPFQSESFLRASLSEIFLKFFKK